MVAQRVGSDRSRADAGRFNRWLLAWSAAHLGEHQNKFSLSLDNLCLINDTPTSIYFPIA
eukprot:10786378-Karenia_brevis.AAC.1